MSTEGTVAKLDIRRTVGKVTIRNFVLVKEFVEIGTSPGEGYIVTTEKPVDHQFTVYNDGSADIIDPTEMVRRNWIVSQLQRALAHKLTVMVMHGETSDMVLGVTLIASEE